MNFQQLVDRVFAQAAKKVKSYSEETYDCRYRDDRGNACFVGACISDDAYLPSIEGMPVDILLRCKPHMLPIDETEPSMREASIAWLVGAQKVHDKCETYEWDEALRGHLHFIAQRYDVEVVVPPAVDEEEA